MQLLIRFQLQVLIIYKKGVIKFVRVRRFSMIERSILIMLILRSFLASMGFLLYKYIAFTILSFLKEMGDAAGRNLCKVPWATWNSLT